MGGNYKAMMPTFNELPKTCFLMIYIPQAPDLRDWSLITGRGGLQNGRGGHVKFYPYKKGGGAEKVIAMLKGGHKKFWGSIYAVA